MIIFLAGLLAIQDVDPPAQQGALNVEIEKIGETPEWLKKILNPGPPVAAAAYYPCEEWREYLEGLSPEQRAELESEDKEEPESQYDWDRFNYSDRYFSSLNNQCVDREWAAIALASWEIESLESPGMLDGYRWHLRYFDHRHWVGTVSILHIALRDNGEIEIRGRTKGPCPADDRDYRVIYKFETWFGGEKSERWQTWKEEADIANIPERARGINEEGATLPIEAISTEYVEYMDGEMHRLIQRSAGHLMVVDAPLTKLLQEAIDTVEHEAFDMFKISDCG